MPTKPLVELKRLAEVFPREDLQVYQVSTEVEPLIDRAEAMAEEHSAGWSIEIGALDWIEAQLFVFWITAEKQMERAFKLQTAQMHLEIAKARVKSGF